MGRRQDGGRGSVTQSALLDRLTSVDDILRDEVIPNQQGLVQAQEGLARAVEAIPDDVGAAPGGGSTKEEILANEQYSVDLSKNVPANTAKADAVTDDWEMEFDAQIISVVVGFPSGTQNAVPMNFGLKGGQRFLPFNGDDDYIAFEEFVHPFPVSTFVEEGEIIEAEYFNLTGDSKFVNCVVGLREVSG